MALRAILPILFGPAHAYGVPLTGSGTEESIGGLTRDDMVRFHAAWFKPNNATLIVVGDTTAAEIKPKLEKLFAKWSPGEPPIKRLDLVPRPSRPVIYLVDKPGAQQSVVLAGTLAAPPRVEDEIALE